MLIPAQARYDNHFIVVRVSVIISDNQNGLQVNLVMMSEVSSSGEPFSNLKIMGVYGGKNGY